MTVADLLADAFGRIREEVHAAVDGLSADDLAYRPDPESNSVGWLIWHLLRVADDHLADAAGTGQAWTDEGWADRFGLALDPADTGYGHGPGQVAMVTVASAELLTGYCDAVIQRSLDYVRGLSDPDLDRIVDTRWDPPVTLGVRLISVISDGLQHAGQAAYLRGLLLRR
ncbi:MAG TPA: DUF664 domain-containing protein [Streptosporangiaceae bacterium]|nr:DUF664 domain-containing protein [Streptosporangiaceae bacterium]